MIDTGEIKRQVSRFVRPYCDLHDVEVYETESGFDVMIHRGIGNEEKTIIMARSVAEIMYPGVKIVQVDLPVSGLTFKCVIDISKKESSV